MFRNQWVQAFGGVLVSAVSLYLIIKQNMVGDHISKLSVPFTLTFAIFAVCGVLVFSISYLVNGHRYRESLRLVGQKPPTLAWTVYVVWVSHAFSVFLPASIATDLGKVSILATKFKIKLKPAAVSVLVDRLWGILSLSVLLGFFGPVFFFTDGAAKIFFWIWVVMAIFLIALFCSRRVLLKAFHDQIANNEWHRLLGFLKRCGKPVYLRSTIFYGLMNALIFLLIVLIVSESLALEVNLLLLIAVCPMVVLVSNLPVFYHGFGGRELAFLMFSDIWPRHSEIEIIQASLVVGLVTWFSALIGVFLVPALAFFNNKKVS